MRKPEKTILAIDSNLENYNIQKKAWSKYKIDIERVGTFKEAFEKIMENKKYFFIAINEDTHPFFYNYLCTIREMISVPIFVVTSNYNIKRKIQALNYGAHSYELLDKDASNNVEIAFSIIKTYKSWPKKIAKTDSVLLAGDIVLIPPYRTVFVNDRNVPLTPKEFGVLHCLMKNNGHLVTYVQLLKTVWGKNYGTSDKNILWKRIDSIRNKISVASDYEYIKSERGIGYMFRQQDKKESNN